MTNVNDGIHIRAAILEEINTPLAIKLVSSRPLLRGQVLVKLAFSGVCRSQLMEIRGSRGQDPWLPHLLGHEGSGVVIGVGAGVTKVKLGDNVIIGWLKGKGIDAEGALYDGPDGVVNSGQVTTFSDYSVVSENRLVIKPKSMSMEVAVLFGCAVPTGAGMVFNQSDFEEKDTVAVMGLGGIGFAAFLAAAAMSPRNLIVIDISDEKIDLARTLGASHSINPLYEDVNETVRAIDPDGVDVCIESAGTVKTIELAFSLVKDFGGRCLFASHPPLGETVRINPHDLIRGKNIHGTWGGGVSPDKDVAIFFDAFEKRGYDLSVVLSKRYSLENINDAFLDIERGSVLRPLIVMDD